MCVIMGCVLQFVELVGYFECDVKKTGLQLHLHITLTFSGKFEWERACYYQCRQGKCHDISIYDFITI